MPVQCLGASHLELTHMYMFKLTSNLGLNPNYSVLMIKRFWATFDIHECLVSDVHNILHVLHFNIVSRKGL